MQVILASKSPRRRELLSMCGVKFKVLVSDADESTTASEPSKIVSEIATKKAFAVKEQYSICDDSLIIAADTMVFANGEALGKPKDREDAIRMISLLQNNCHTVITAVALLFKGQLLVKHEQTKVYFKKMIMQEIENYIDSSSPYDKAGAYAIQESAAKFIYKIEGDYCNVVGLPLSLLYDMSKQIGVQDIFNDKI